MSALWQKNLEGKGEVPAEYGLVRLFIRPQKWLLFC